MKKKIYTICFLENEDEVLLAMKKRGWGEGWWNGYGGKPEEGETVEEASIREVWEESGIKAKKINEKAKIIFTQDGLDFITEAHVFEIIEFEGEPKETEEMKPKWFKKTEIPYEKMWDADKIWFPVYLKSKQFKAKFHYDENHKIVSQNIEILK